MKNTMKCLVIALVAAIVFSFAACGDGAGDGNDGSREVYVVDVSEETDWDYFVVAKDGSSAFYNVDETGIPTSLVFKPDKNSDDGTTILFKENGLPDKVITKGHVLYFGSFRGYQYDMAVIKPDNTIEYHYDIESDVNWDAYNARAVSGQGRGVMEYINTGLEIVGHGIGIGTCGAMFVMPGFALGCGTYLLSTAGEMMIKGLVESGDLSGTAGDIAEAIIDALNCFGGKDVLDCIQLLSGIVTLIFGDDIDLLMEKGMEVLEAGNMIEGGEGGWTAVEGIGGNELGTVIATLSIRAIAYGGGDSWVAGGDDGAIGYYDGNWKAAATGTASDVFEFETILAIAYGDGVFVAGGFAGRMAYSTNGRNWTTVTNRPFSGYFNHIYGIAYGNGKFVAVAAGGIAYSTDGINWTKVSDSDSPLEGYQAITYGDGKFVAGYLGSIAYSTNGTSWTKANIPFSGTPNFIEDIAYGGGRFVVVADWGRTAYSTNGINWTASEGTKIWGTDRNSFNSIAYGNGMFVAVGADGKILYSSNGASWTAVPYSTIWQYPYDDSSTRTASIRAIAYGNGMFVAGGDVGKMAYCYRPNSVSTSGGGSGNTTPPELSRGNVTRTSDTQAVIGFTSSDAGFAYYIVQNPGAAEPANTAVRNGVPLGAVEIGANSGKKVVTLTAGAKDIYVVVRNAAGDISDPLRIPAAAYDGWGGGGNNPGVGGSGTEANPFTLTAGVWTDGSITSIAMDSAVWYSFSVTGGTTYNLYWNDSIDGNETKTLDVIVSVDSSYGTSILFAEDDGWDGWYFTASQTGTVIIKVEPYFSGATGTFAIMYEPG